MKKDLRLVGALLLGFVIGVGVTYQLLDNDTISINGKRVKVVDVMYQYELNGEVIEGDYSIVSQQGYEYSPFGEYHSEYKNAKLKK